ncbi:MAG: lipoyl(octanoyl) transferase LipB [Candidatus Marinimicrobia bacterium]|nr:lipoyl(octanoyl) transferase LipB [Candidatus Neomarinimicrobiota bacterium]
MKDISNYNKLQFFQIIKKNCNLEINSFWLGKVDYHFAWGLQKQIHQSVSQFEMNGVILYLEHDSVYTFGKNANQNHLLPSYPKDAEVIQIDRGGDITYHGPGQLVGYPIINLNIFKKSISWYMRTLENSIIDSLSAINILGKRVDGLTGVWVEDEKICAMGVRLAKWTSMHGFALNINPEMKYFDGMIPCGIFEFGVTSIQGQLNIELDIKEIANQVDSHIQCQILKENNYETSRIYKKATA